MCLYTDIYECMRARQMRKVLDGVKRLISHYAEQWRNKASDRRWKTIRERKSRDSRCVCVCDKCGEAVKTRLQVLALKCGNLITL